MQIHNALLSLQAGGRTQKAKDANGRKRNTALVAVVRKLGRCN